jgi:NADH-quinone oxidoreductase subunit E
VSWRAIERKTVSEDDLGPGLSAAAEDKIRSFFPRYPTKRAVMLPALHMAQDEIGYVSLRAMREIAELLEVPPAAVMDVVTFYTHFWTHPKGRKTIVACRSLTCELMGGQTLLAALKEKLGIDEHETTPDGRYSLMTEECLAACEHGPCLLINEKLHKCVRIADLDRILNDPHNDRLGIPRSELFDAPAGSGQAR